MQRMLIIELFHLFVTSKIGNIKSTTFGVKTVGFYTAKRMSLTKTLAH